MTTERKYPAYVAKTARGWKQQKRREWRELRASLEQFRLGCAYTPIYPQLFDAIDEAIKQGTAALSQKEWGR